MPLKFSRLMDFSVLFTKIASYVGFLKTDMKTLTLSECDRILKDKLVKNGIVKGNPTFMQDVGLFMLIP